METAAHIPLSERINFRLIAFIAVIGLLVGMPLYWYLDSAISGGVKDLGNGYHEVDLKAMSTFAFDPVRGKTEDIPAKWRELDGKKVVVEGEMWLGGSRAEEVRAFELVYSIARCCFSGPPQIQHFVQSKAATQSGTVPYYQGPVRVTGTLHVRVQREGGKVSSVYQLDVESVEPA